MFPHEIVLFIIQQMASTRYYAAAKASTSPSTARRFKSTKSIDYMTNVSFRTVLKLADACGCEMIWEGQVLKSVDDWRRVLNDALRDRGAMTECSKAVGRDASHLHKLRNGPTIPKLFIACIVSRMLFDRAGLVVRVRSRAVN